MADVGSYAFNHALNTDQRWSTCTLQAQLQQKYLQPVAKTKVYSKGEAKEQAARIQRLVDGLGAYEKPQ